MELDAKPCEAILIVEFYGNVAERLAALSARRLGLRTLICKNQAEMNLVWAVRKAACRCSPAASGQPSRSRSSKTRLFRRRSCRHTSPVWKR
jgi:hypothetical protein